MGTVEKQSFYLNNKESNEDLYLRAYQQYRNRWEQLNQTIFKSFVYINKEENLYYQDRVLYFNMFTKKLTEWTEKNDTSESDIERFFTKNKFLHFSGTKNSFKGFLIDYEFLFLKKNFTKNLKKESPSIENSSFISGILSSKKAIKSNMKGMMSSTIFALNDSQISSISQGRKDEMFPRKFMAIRISEEDKIPLMFDFLLEYALNSDLTAISDLKWVEDFLMHLQKDNMAFSTREKLGQIYKHLTLKMTNKKKMCKLVFAYLTNYIMLKQRPVEFSCEFTSFLEDLVIDHFPTFCLGKRKDLEFVLFVLILCYEISVDHSSVQKPFSEKFLKFLRSMDFLYKRITWKNFLGLLIQQTVLKKAGLYFTNLTNQDPSSDKMTRKVKISTFQEAILMLMNISFYLLQLPHNVILSNFVYANQKTCELPVSEIMHLSSFMEDKMASVYNSIRRCEHTQTKNHPQCGKQLLPFVFQEMMPFFDLGELDFLTSLLLLGKRFTLPLLKSILKKILTEKQNLSRQYRIKIYQKLIVLDAEFFYDSIKLSKHCSITQGLKVNYQGIIQKDVERTKFYKGDPVMLEKLLEELADFVPSMGYYQGLNCIAAFMLDYTGDFMVSYDILSFLMHKQMEKYFLGDFQMINKLIFIGEQLIKQFEPDFYERLSCSDIGHDYYLSAIIVTVYFNVLQHFEQCSFLLDSLDLFLSEGWSGFFKVFIYLIKINKNNFRKIKDQMLIHYLKKDFFSDVEKKDLTNLKTECRTIKISNRSITRIEKKYYKSKYVFQDFWNTFFKNKRENRKQQKTKSERVIPSKVNLPLLFDKKKLENGKNHILPISERKLSLKRQSEFFLKSKSRKGSNHIISKPQEIVMDDIKKQNSNNFEILDQEIIPPKIFRKKAKNKASTNKKQTVGKNPSSKANTPTKTLPFKQKSILKKLNKSSKKKKNKILNKKRGRNQVSSKKGISKSKSPFRKSKLDISKVKKRKQSYEPSLIAPPKFNKLKK